MGVFFWRNIAMPAIAATGGKKFPSGKVAEFAYGNLPDEKLDFIAPAQQHPYLIRSLLKALVWIKKNYPQYGTVHLIGDSAGGNLAMMLGIYLSNPNLLKALDTKSVHDMPKIKSIVDIFGVNDRVSWVEDGFPSAKLFIKVYVQNTTTPNIPIVPMDFEHIENLPPTFIVGAGNDKLLRSSKIWAEHISKQFKDVRFKIYEGADHGFFSFGKGCEELLDNMLDFFKKHN